MKSLWKKITRTQEQRAYTAFSIFVLSIFIMIGILSPMLFLIGLVMLLIIGITIGICYLITRWVEKGEKY